MSAAVALPGFNVLPPVDSVVWGIDPSTRGISIAKLRPTHIPEDPTSLSWDTLKVRQGPRRLAGLLDDLEWGFLPDRADDDYGVCPSVIYLEQPFGAKPELVHPQSYYVVGVLQAILGRKYPDARLELVTPPTWKKWSVGHGFAKKPDILEWSQRAGYTGSSQDEADAVGIAVAGAVLSRQ